MSTTLTRAGVVIRSAELGEPTRIIEVQPLVSPLPSEPLAEPESEPLEVPEEVPVEGGQRCR
jgi:hypothetical protein